jgi:hypothetical protein
MPRAAYCHTAHERSHRGEGEQIAGVVAHHLRREWFRLGRTGRLRLRDIQAGRGIEAAAAAHGRSWP